MHRGRLLLVSISVTVVRPSLPHRRSAPPLGCLFTAAAGLSSGISAVFIAGFGEIYRASDSIGQLSPEFIQNLSCRYTHGSNVQLIQQATKPKFVK